MDFVMEKIIAEEKDITAFLARCAQDIISDFTDLSPLVFIGIQRRGVQLAGRLSRLCEEQSGDAVPLGVLDITFYRDDLSMVAQQPIVHSTAIPFNLDDRDIILVDDVIYTGRTVRAALDALVDFGRPRCVRLAVLVDRGGRELPVQPDYVGWKEKVPKSEAIAVHVKELDGQDCIERISLSSHTREGA
jgi:pyrimidine operon attenuation protein / uracil phosphoribosyltransferase